MSTDIESRIEAAWTAAWNQGETDALDGLLAPDYVRRGRSTQTLADLKSGIAACRSGLPDLVTTIDDCVVGYGRIATRWHSTGTLLDVPPTGRRLTVSGATFSHIENGMITEEWVTWDPRQMLQALGIITLHSAFDENGAFDETRPTDRTSASDKASASDKNGHKEATTA